MSKQNQTSRVDVANFARAGDVVAANDPLSFFPRLQQDCVGETDGREVAWRAVGSMRERTAGATPQPWLQVTGSTTVPMTCQRCLHAMEVPLKFDQEFRFVADEATAELEDEDSEEDVLAIRPDFPLRELVEDELLLAAPPVPMHEVCPDPLPMIVGESAIEGAGEREHPFAALQSLLHKPVGK